MGRPKKYHIDPGEKDFDPPEFPWIRIFPQEVCYLVTFHQNTAQVLPHPHDHSWLKGFGLSFGIRGLWDHHQNSVMMAWKYIQEADQIGITIYAHVNGQVIKGHQGQDLPILMVDLEDPVFCSLKVDRRNNQFILMAQVEGGEPSSGIIDMDPLIRSVYWHSKDLGLWHGGKIAAQAFQEITKQRMKDYPAFVSF